MAARLAPDNVRRMHQSLHHVVADAPWSDEAVLEQVRESVLPAMQKHGPVVCWIVDDTGFPKKGRHSVGVARQYCGQVGKQDNCRVAVSLSVATWSSSLPIAYRLYLPEVWASDKKRRKRPGSPKRLHFRPSRRSRWIRSGDAVQQDVPRGVVLADAGYGIDGQFRSGVTELGLEYVVGVQSSVTVWEPGKEPLPPVPRKKMGRPPRLLRRDRGSSAGFGKATGPVIAVRGVEDRHLAARHTVQTPVPLRRRARPPGTSRLLESRTTSGRMAADRVAERRSRADQILAIHAAGRHEAEGSGGTRQTPLDHRTGLRGTEAGTRPGSLRRQRLARLSPSRHLMHCSLWVPCGRAEPFFPLSPRRQSWIISPRAAAGLPAPGLASAPSGIIRTRSPRCGP